MSGARPEPHRCNKTAADDKWVSASLIIWTQFYAPRFSPSNRHHFLSAVGTAEMEGIRHKCIMPMLAADWPQGTKPRLKYERLYDAASGLLQLGDCFRSRSSLCWL